MSKHIKHINLYFMIALTLIIGIFISENVYAATIHYQQCSTSSIGLHESYGKYAVKNSVKNSGYYDGVINHVTIYNANGHVVYCTEEGMPSLNHSDTLTGTDYVS